ncbi:MAG: STAS domain-containing protein [Verrucomicrobia bacterium]|nr:STAS domain-containing protein [Verrucomicrobiota bacterium]
MEFENSTQDGVTVIAVGGRLDGVGAPEVEAHCLSLIEEGVVRMILNLSGVDYISSAGLRSLLVVAKAIKSADGELLLCELTPMVRQVMEISGFDQILAVAPDCKAALKMMV